METLQFKELDLDNDNDLASIQELSSTFSLDDECKEDGGLYDGFLAHYYGLDACYEHDRVLAAYCAIKPASAITRYDEKEHVREITLRAIVFEHCYDVCLSNAAFIDFLETSLLNWFGKVVEHIQDGEISVIVSGELLLNTYKHNSTRKPDSPNFLYRWSMKVDVQSLGLLSVLKKSTVMQLKNSKEGKRAKALIVSGPFIMENIQEESDAPIQH